MSSDPEWLPEMAPVSPWQHGGAECTYEMLYAIFRRDFVVSRPRYAGHEVWFFGDMDDGKEKVFWHLTSRVEKPRPVPRRMQHVVPAGPAVTERYPDPRRSERLPWVRPLIENATADEVLAWDYREGNGDVHTYIWLEDWDFVVILKKYPHGRRRLLTAFYIDKQYKRDDFARKYDNRLP